MRKKNNGKQRKNAIYKWGTYCLYIRMAELEDIIPRRDYKLLPHLHKKCVKCGSYLFLLSHHDTISQWCGKHINPIKRSCSYCGKLFNYDELDCDVCDLEIEALADAEVGVERNEKTIRKINRKYKRGEIAEIDYQTQKEICEDEIKLCTKEAERIRKHRGIGLHSEIPTQKL